MPTRFWEKRPNVPIPEDGVSLNDSIYQVVFIDTNTISLNKWDATEEDYFEDFEFTPATTSLYVGCGEISLLPKMKIQTKDFNPYTQQGTQLKISYVDLLTDSQIITEEELPNTVPSVSINLYIDSAINQAANLIVGNQRLETSLPSPYYPKDLTSDYSWHRFFATSAGQFMRIEITYDNALMNDMHTHQSNFTMNAMRLWVRPGARTVLG